jgi:uncharacterized protein involved in cysteine biosynthesis
MKWLLQGLRLAFREPRLRPYVWRPVAFSVLIYFVLLCGGFGLIVPRMSGWSESLGAPAWLGGGAGAILWGIAWWFLSAPIFLTVMAMVSAQMWDPLSRHVEEMRTGVLPGPGLSRSLFMVDMAMRIPFAFVIMLLCLTVGWIGFGLVGAALAGFLGLLDFTSCALGRRGHLLPTQFFRVFGLKGAFTFWIGIALVSLLPFLHAFLFPAWVAGGTLMVLESEAK